jgi:hypothetical protein
LSQNSAQTRTDITSKQFATLLKHVVFAQEHGFHKYQSREIQRFEQIFVGHDSNNYSISDLLHILRSFVALDSHGLRLPKIVEKVIELTYQSIKSSDQDFLDLFKLFHEQGVLEKNDELC